MKRLSEFESLEDFGFVLEVNPDGKLNYVKCDPNFDKIRDLESGTIVYTDIDSTTGRFLNLNEILSGGSTTVDVADIIRGDQAELSLDYSVATSLAFLGSVYSTVLIGVNKIKTNYPNGFSILVAIAGPSTLMFNNADTYMYGAAPFSITDYTNFELVQTLNGLHDQTFEINSQTSMTGGTYSMLFLDATPTVAAGYAHIVQPKAVTLDKFYATLTAYELDLLVPPADRTNAYPRDAVATRNVLFEGTEYNEFLAIESDWANKSDDEDSNFIWRKLYPDGQKNLDSDDNLMQKMVLTLAMNFDKIKKYQDQLKYQHTIGYSNSDHISKDLVEILAKQWNWSLGNNLNHDDYGAYIYSTYDNYITGQSQQKISSKDVNFEIWRRVLSNLVTLYKKKGTKEAIKYVANMYGLPEALLWVEELVNFEEQGKLVLTRSESNIVVPIDGVMYYVDDLGNKVAMKPRRIRNTKYLNINISPVDAIEFDQYDWGWENHPDVGSPSGTIAISSATQVDQSTFISETLAKMIDSKNAERYAFRYAYLPNIKDAYNTQSVNQYNINKLAPYMNFLDDNWNVLLTNLVPASSKLLSIGTLYKNPWWDREKYQWNESEIVSNELPFNEEVILPHATPVVNVKTSILGLVDIEGVGGALKTSRLGELDAPSLGGQFASNLFGSIESQDPVVSFINEVFGSQTVVNSPTGDTYTIASPILESISGQGGTLDYVNYTTDALVVTNKNSIDLVFSGSNLSNSGYTKFEFELFEKAHDEAVFIDESKTLSIMSVLFESDVHGMYRTSSVDGIDELDYIQIKSEYLPYLNTIVQVTHIDTGSTQIRTKPKIGLFSLPVGTDNNVVDWFDFIRSGALSRLESLERGGQLTYQEIISVMVEISKLADGGDLSDVPAITRSVFALDMPEFGPALFDWFYTQDAGVIYGCLLVLEFLKGNSLWSLSSNDLSLVNMVATNQTKATFNRVVNFFDWKSPVQTVSYDNVISPEFTTSGVTFDAPHTSTIYEPVMSNNESGTSFINSTQAISANTFDFTTVFTPNMLPFHVNIASSSFNDGNRQVTAFTSSILYVSGSSIVDEDDTNPIFFGYFSDLMLGSNFSGFARDDRVAIDGSTNNDGVYLVTQGTSMPTQLAVRGGLLTNDISDTGSNISFTRIPPVSERNFDFPPINVGARSSGNTMGLSGAVTLGGTNDLNADILVDKTEYFYRSRAFTHAPIDWGNVSGLENFHITSSGGTLVESGYNVDIINGVKYYGRYFMYMITPQVAVSNIDGLISSGGVGTTLDASVTAKWNGVSDSNRLEIQYLTAATATSPYTLSTDMDEDDWNDGATTINVPARSNVGDDHIYTIQTTLEPDTYYWWRVKNFRSKLNMFGHNLEYFTGTEPEVFKTGGYSDGGGRSGEIPIEATPPDPRNPDGGSPSKLPKISR